jgi:iron(III) transport system substrate-binding protein
MARIACKRAGGLTAMVVALLLPLCVQAADWQAEWDRTVAAANKEGALVITAPSGREWRNQIMLFEKDYPAIKVSATPMAGRDLWPRFVKEREAGQYLWDLRVGGTDIEAYRLKNEGHFASARAALMLPEVTDPTKWHGGIDGLFADNDKKYVMQFCAYDQIPALYNNEAITDPAVQELKNIVDPKFTGKISMADPRAGSSLTAMGVFDKVFGDDFLRQLLGQQKPVITKQPRQQLDWLLSGRYPITMGLPTAALVEFEQSGGKLDKVAKVRGFLQYSQGVGGLTLFTHAPHPNAAKVFTNWILTQKVQARLMKAVKLNSRRVDVPIEDPETELDWSRYAEYYGGQTEALFPYQTRASQLVQELVK